MTAVPLERIQTISGLGVPMAEHSTVAPVVLEKSTRLMGSWMKRGPARSSSTAETETKTRMELIVLRRYIVPCAQLSGCSINKHTLSALLTVDRSGKSSTNTTTKSTTTTTAPF